MMLLKTLISNLNFYTDEVYSQILIRKEGLKSYIKAWGALLLPHPQMECRIGERHHTNVTIQYLSEYLLSRLALFKFDDPQVKNLCFLKLSRTLWGPSKFKGPSMSSPSYM